MDFAKKHLEKYGWSEGKGLGRTENGISKAIKPKLKFDNAGIGHDAAEQFTNNWWERAYNSATNNIDIETGESEVRMKIKDPDAVEISTKSYSVQNLKKSTSLLYGSFIKTAKLTEKGTEHYNVSILETEPLKSYQGMTDEELFATCEGRTAHKAARHGFKLSGKLTRIEKQEKLLLRKMKKVSLSEECCSKVERKLKKLEKQKQVCGDKFTPLIDTEVLPSTSQITLKKKSKKRKSVTFNETVTKIYTDQDTSFDSEVASVRDDTNSGSDEGIEQDLQNNNNDADVDHHRAFEEARLNFSDLSKAERKKLKKKRKLEVKLANATTIFLKSIATQVADGSMQEEKDSLSKKRKHFEEKEDFEHKRSSTTESPERLKRKRNKKKKHKLERKQKKEDAKVLSITKSLEGFCRISESD